MRERGHRSDKPANRTESKGEPVQGGTSEKASSPAEEANWIPTESDKLFSTLQTYKCLQRDLKAIAALEHFALIDLTTRVLSTYIASYAGGLYRDVMQTKRPMTFRGESLGPEKGLPERDEKQPKGRKRSVEPDALELTTLQTVNCVRRDMKSIAAIENIQLIELTSQVLSTYVVAYAGGGFASRATVRLSKRITA